MSIFRVQYVCSAGRIFTQSTEHLQQLHNLLQFTVFTLNVIILPVLPHILPIKILLYGGFIITLRHTTVGRTSLEEGSVLRRDL
jgi:hypothetical protein